MRSKSKRSITAERKLLEALQLNHGYMFTEMPRKTDRFSTHFRRDRKTGKYTLNTPKPKLKRAARKLGKS